MRSALVSAATFGMLGMLALVACDLNKPAVEPQPRLGPPPPVNTTGNTTDAAAPSAAPSGLAAPQPGDVQL